MSILGLSCVYRTPGSHPSTTGAVVSEIGTTQKTGILTKCSICASNICKRISGVSSPVTITVTTLVDSWLTAKLQFDDLPDNKHLHMELPRRPLLLSPRKSEQFTFSVTSNVEINTSLHFTIFLKDASIDGDVELRGELKVKFKTPTIEAVSADGLNKITFSPISENSSATKTFVIISECPADLQLKLSIVEGESLFSIKNVQEINKSDINKILLHRQSRDQISKKDKSKAIKKQLCRLTQGNAIKVTINFVSPRLFESQISCKYINDNDIIVIVGARGLFISPEPFYGI